MAKFEKGLPAQQYIVKHPNTIFRAGETPVQERGMILKFEGGPIPNCYTREEAELYANWESQSYKADGTLKIETDDIPKRTDELEIFLDKWVKNHKDWKRGVIRPYISPEQLVKDATPYKCFFCQDFMANDPDELRNHISTEHKEKMVESLVAKNPKSPQKEYEEKHGWKDTNTAGSVNDQTSN